MYIRFAKDHTEYKSFNMDHYIMFPIIDGNEIAIPIEIENITSNSSICSINIKGYRTDAFYNTIIDYLNDIADAYYNLFNLIGIPLDTENEYSNGYFYFIIDANDEEMIVDYKTISRVILMDKTDNSWMKKESTTTKPSAFGTGSSDDEMIEEDMYD